MRIGARALAKDRGFTVAAVVVLGLGLGAATVMVGVINAVFVRPLPFPEPDRIFNVVTYGVGPAPNPFQTPAAVALTRDHSQAFSALAGIRETPGSNLASDRGSTFVRSIMVTAGFFRVFGVDPRLGRTFVRDDETAPSTVVLSHAVWADHFDGARTSVGQAVRLGGRPHTVIGVMPAGFCRTRGPTRGRRSAPDPNGMGRNYQLIGRLAPGGPARRPRPNSGRWPVSSATSLPALAELPTVTPDGPRRGVRPYRDVLAGRSGNLVWLLTAAVGAMLLIVCANTAGLLLARAVGTAASWPSGPRSRRPGPPAQQLLTESIPVGGGGGRWASPPAPGARGLVAAQPHLAVWGIALDAPTLLGIAGGGARHRPGLRPSARPVRRPRQARGRAARRGVGGATAVRGAWVRRSLVVAQVTLCTVLLTAVGVFLRTFVGLSASEARLRARQRAHARTSLQSPDYGSGAAVSALYRRTLADLARVPGVEAAAVASNLPVQRGLNMPLRETPGGPITGGVDWRYVAGLPAGPGHSPRGRPAVRRSGPPHGRAAGGVGQRGVRQAVRRRADGARHAPPDNGHRHRRPGARDRRRDRRRADARRHRDPADGVRPAEQVPDDLLAAVHGFFR